jgi:hypothetical protein
LLLTPVASRDPGWTRFSVDLPGSSSGTGHLRVEVDGAQDDWAHFVFDLWGR